MRSEIPLKMNLELLSERKPNTVLIRLLSSADTSLLLVRYQRLLE